MHTHPHTNIHMHIKIARHGGAHLNPSTWDEDRKFKARLGCKDLDSKNKEKWKGKLSGTGGMWYSAGQAKPRALMESWEDKSLTAHPVRWWRLWRGCCPHCWRQSTCTLHCHFARRSECTVLQREWYSLEGQPARVSGHLLSRWSAAEGGLWHCTPKWHSRPPVPLCSAAGLQKWVGLSQTEILN